MNTGLSFLNGYAIGLTMIIFIGPVFFTLLKTALSYGFRAGMMVAIGIFMSDALVVLLCSFGAIQFFKNPEHQYWLSIGGSIILFVLGFKYLLRPNVVTDTDIKLRPGHYTGFLVNGFMVNFVNPFVFLIWIGIIGVAQGRYGTGKELWIFLAAVLAGIFSTDTIKVVFAHRIKRFIKPKFLLRAYQIIGIVLIVFALRMLWFALA